MPRGYTATINCGSGARRYTGDPFAVTTPAQAGSTVVCTIVNRAPASTPTPKPKPVLVVDKSVATRVIRTGQSARFVIKVTNRGRGPATNVIVCDRPADGLVFRRAPGARFNNGDACWRIARLGAKRSTSFAVRLGSVRVQKRTLFVNVATVTSGASCSPRTALASERTGAICRARAVVVVLPARVEKPGGGVTG